MRWWFTVMVTILDICRLRVLDRRMCQNREQHPCRRPLAALAGSPRATTPQYCVALSPQRHNPPRWRSVAATLLCVLGVAAAAPVWADDPPDEAAPKRSPADAVPDADSAVRGYRTLRTWLDEWAPPARPAPASLPSCVGAAVLLRFDGQLIGRGSVISASEAAALDRDEHAGGGGGGPLWSAFLDAFTEADRRLPVSHDVLRPARAREAGRRVTLSVELAGPLVPITPATFDELDATLAPGLDGIAIRLDRQTRAIFPGVMFASGVTPSSAARQLVATMTGRPDAGLEKLSDLREKSKLTISRFRTTHLAQGTEGDEPRFLLRGSRFVAQGELDSVRELRDFAAAVARHLVRRVPDDRAAPVVGVRRPWLVDDRGEPATVVQRGIAAFALQRFAALPGTDPARAAEAAQAADRAVAALLDPASPTRWPGGDPVMAAAVLLAGPGPEAAAANDAVRAALASEDTLAKLPPGARSMVAMAGVIIGAPGAAEAVRAIFRQTPPEQLTTELPWLGWAEQRLTRSAGLAQPPSAAGLRTMRDRLWAAQVGTFTADPDDADLLGGLIFQTTTRPLPTWHTARPLAFAASMLSDPGLTTPAERPREIARVLSSLRFLRQLQSDEATSWMEADPTSSAGGIRSAPWDAAMPIDAASMTLLALCESIEALDRVAAQK